MCGPGRRDARQPHGQDGCATMKILVAPDKFKGTLNARDAAQNIAKGLLDVLPDAQIEVVPMADGGEGTAAVFAVYVAGGD